MEEKIIDASNKIAGRLASIVAKMLLEGEKVVIVNAEKAIISGNPQFLKKFFLERRHRGDPYKGPFYPRYPDQILKRMIRGMLPYKKEKGRNALKRLKVFIGIPNEYKNAKFFEIKVKEAKDLRCKYMTLGEISEYIGAKKLW